MYAEEEQSPPGVYTVFTCSTRAGVLAGYARILVTTSVESQIAAPGYLPYTASKWALMALQEEWYSSHVSTGHPTNIDFVTILPGTVNTSLGYSVSYGAQLSCGRP